MAAGAALKRSKHVIGAPGGDQDTRALSEAKLAELILYISQKCAGDLYFGATKLNKILYFSDFLHYGRTGRPITGVEYQKLKRGPAPRKLLPIRDLLIKEKALAIQPVMIHGRIQKRLVNLREPKTNEMFSASEIEMVDDVIRILSDANAAECSRLSYDFTAGLAAFKENETIPYGTILISNEPLTEAQIVRGREIAERFGLLQ